MALQARDGARLWNRAVDGVQAAGDGFVIVTSGGNELLALHAADDTPAWQAQYQGGAVQLLGGLVYVDESPDPLIALDEYTGALVWTLPRWKQTAIAASASGAQIYVDCLEPRNPMWRAKGSSPLIPGSTTCSGNNR